MQDNQQIEFPFSAVQGQDLFKLALILSAINPTLGGVLISGPRGCAKSTLARALAALLPCEQGVKPEFVTLPLGASEEMLVGTLNLEQVLNNKSLQFSPGLLSKAHGGILYVDEVNLLPNHLVDQLLDVASSGINHIERDGISHQHVACFTLIGTMNPDEGELRPQLQDRFGLMVLLDNQYSLQERVEIIKTRHAFEADKSAFCAALDMQQRQLQIQISAARARLSAVSCDDNILMAIAQRCQQANVEGLRADIMMHRASLTYAAWCGRTQVNADDIEQVAPLVLLHRQQSNNLPNNGKTQPPSRHDGSAPQAPENNSGQHQSNGFSRPNQEAQPNDNSSEKGKLGEWGAMSEIGECQLTDSTCPPEFNAQMSRLLSEKLCASKASYALNNEHSKGEGNRQLGDKKSVIDTLKPDWFATITRNFGHWPPQRLHYKKQPIGQGRCHLVLLDTSASTLTDSLSSVAKSIVASISQHAYLQRDMFTLLGFGNDSVETIIKQSRAPKKITPCLDKIAALGGTPLRLALQQAKKTVQQMSKQYPSLAMRCYLLTDGRSRVDLSDLSLNVATLLIDIEKSAIKRGRGKIFAQQLGASYVAIQG